MKISTQRRGFKWRSMDHLEISNITLNRSTGESFYSDVTEEKSYINYYLKKQGSNSTEKYGTVQ